MKRVPNPHIDGLVQERHNSIANALELRLSCTNLLTNIDEGLLTFELHSKIFYKLIWKQNNSSQEIYDYRQISNIKRTQSQALNVSCPVLQ